MCQINDRFKINPDVTWKKLESQIVTLHDKTHQYHVLNNAAALIFEHSDGKNTVDEIAKELATKFKIRKDQALKDTQETIDGMVKLGLIVGLETIKAGYARPAIRLITEKDFNDSITKGIPIAPRSLLG